MIILVVTRCEFSSDEFTGSNVSSICSTLRLVQRTYISDSLENPYRVCEVELETTGRSRSGDFEELPNTTETLNVPFIFFRRRIMKDKREDKSIFIFGVLRHLT